jgi:hypothetical protein
MRRRAPFVCLLALGLGPALASAQGLRELAGAWAQGDYRAPLVCVLDGAAREALRRVRIQPPRPVDSPDTLRVTFQDLDAPPGISCTTHAGGRELNVVGALQLSFEGRSRVDIGDLDFRNTLRRAGGFGYRIRAGALRLTEIGAAGAPPESVSFAGGTAEIREVPRGSDAARRLAVFGSERQRTLRITSESGRTLTFELVALPRP